ncbi:MAG TPA: winged helix DNA-binding domain-containing protein [Longimicrobiales bacterium]|nr:winged helix DNA-binding domain-containing protein [Longimicrobiales bacterium]
MSSITPDRTRAARLRYQRLTSAPLRTANDVVAWFGAMQSQEYAIARWSIGLRARNLRDTDVERAYARGDVLRTHVLRPTWHFVAPADIRWMSELTAPRIQAQMAGRHRQLELSGKLIAKAAATIGKALENGTHLTRTEIQALLESNRIDLKNERLGHVMMLLELDALVCSGAPKGRQHTYALLDERAPHAASMGRDDALAELARRFFQSHGPASEKDLARWATLTLTDVRRSIELLGDDIQRTEVDGAKWYSIGAPPRRSPNAPRALLLQVYDEYVGGYGDTRSVIDPHGLTHMSPAVRLPFMHVVVLDGYVVGHWRPAKKKGDSPVDLKLARRLDAEACEAVEVAVERFRSFTEN